LAAVIVPFLSERWFQLAHLVERRCKRLFIPVDLDHLSFFCGTSTATISSLNRPRSIAALARL